MSLLFNYSKIKDTVNFGAMLPGQKSRNTLDDIQYATIAHPEDFNSAKNYVENGEIVALYRENDAKGNNVVYCADLTADEFSASFQLGVVLADVVGQTERYPGPNFIYKHLKNTPVTVMTAGYVWVPVQDDGTISNGSAVYTDKKGGVVATQSDAVVAIPNAKFTGLYGYPLSSTQNGTSGSNLTGKTAEICIGVNLI